VNLISIEKEARNADIELRKSWNRLFCKFHVLRKFWYVNRMETAQVYPDEGAVVDIKESLDRAIEEINIEYLLEFTEASSEKIVPEANLLSDLGLNSLDVVNVVIAFEDEFLIEVPDEDIKNFITVGDVEKYITERRKKKN